MPSVLVYVESKIFQIDFDYLSDLWGGWPISASVYASNLLKTIAPFWAYNLTVYQRFQQILTGAIGPDRML